MGPGAGSAGGEVVFEGRYADLRTSGTLTGAFLERSLPIKERVRTPGGWLPIRDAREHNLQGIDVDIPTGVLTVVTGVAGSGKSSLIEGVFLPDHPEAIVIDQSAVGTSTRSNPATYTGVMDDVRKAFAAANKVDAGLFSFNSKGACENCKGLGRDLHGALVPRRGQDAVRDLQRQAVQGRGARVPARRAVDLGRARADGGPGARALPPARDRAQAPGDERRRARLPDARAAAEHAVGRGVPADQARERAPPQGQHLRARRADDRPPHVGHEPPARDARPARRRRQQRDRHRAQRRRDPQRGLDHRPGPGGRHEGRPARVQRHADRACWRSRSR